MPQSDISSWCQFRRQEHGKYLDSLFDGGEFSSEYHDRILETMTPCGVCPACLEAKSATCPDDPDCPY